MNFDSNMNEFELKKNDFLRIFYEYHYIFEIQKCCGYSEWISVYKKDTIKQLYNNLNIQFATNEKSIYTFFYMRFSECICCYSVSHCSNKPTIKIID